MSNKIKVLGRRMCGVAAVASTLVSAAGHAAENGSGRNALILEEVVVTAQKREERLQDVPISISVLGGAQLDRSSVQGVSDALSRVPGVAVVQSTNGTTQLNIRGVGALAEGWGGATTSAYYLDSVPLGLVRSNFLPDANAFDLDRVEVLRGPQGTLYGSSALNGVVRVLTKDADLDDFEFKARGSTSSTHGSDDLSYRGDLALNAPIIPGKLAARAVLGYQELGGWIDRPNKEDANDGDIRNMRLKINAQPTDALSVGLSAWLSRSDLGGRSISNEMLQQVALLDEPISTDFDVYDLKIGYSFPNVTLTSMTSYLEFENSSVTDISPLNPLYVDIPADTFSQEIILNSTHGGQWRWNIGGFYRDANETLIQKIVPFLDGDNNFESKSFAAFGELTRLFMDGKFELTAGLRYFEDEVTMTEVRGIGGALLSPVTDNFDSVSPRAVLNWHPRTDLTLYASYSEGFRSGFPQGPNSLRLALAAGLNIGGVREDTLTNYELGTKGTLWGGRLAFEAALYYMDWQDVQQSISVPLSGAAALSVIINSGSASGMGFDFGVTTQPVEGLELGLNISWNDLSMDSDVFSYVAQPSGPPAPVLLFASGDRLNLSPEYTVGMSADYVFPLGGTGFEGRFSASANYTSELSNRTIVAGVQRVGFGDAIFMANTSFSIQAPSHWVATLFADNINNDVGIVAPAAVVGIPQRYSRPRTIGVQLEYRY